MLVSVIQRIFSSGKVGIGMSYGIVSLGSSLISIGGSIGSVGSSLGRALHQRIHLRILSVCGHGVVVSFGKFGNCSLISTHGHFIGGDSTIGVQCSVSGSACGLNRANNLGISGSVGTISS